MVSKQEMNRLLDGSAPTLADDLYDERYGFRTPFEPPTVDAFQAAIAANPLLMLDRGSVTGYVEQIMEKVRTQQALSEQRMHSGDPEEKLNEIIKLYAWGELSWSGEVSREFGGLSEEELVAEAINRGHHLRLDLDKRWDAMHQLLTGMTLRERRKLTTLANAQEWIEKAKNNDSLPSDLVNEIESARNAIYGMDKEMQQYRNELACKLHAVDQESDEALSADNVQAQLLSGVIQSAWRAPGTLHRTLLQVAAMQKQIEEQDIGSFDAACKSAEARLQQSMNLVGAPIRSSAPVYMTWAQLINGLVESAKSARLIESILNDIVLRMRTRQLSDSELRTAMQVDAECQRLDTLLSVPGWRNHFSSLAVTTISTTRLSDADELLSLAVSGGHLCPGPNAQEASYLTVDQTRAVADLLVPLTSQELSRKHHLRESEDSYDFYQFKKFYLRAASLEAGVIVYFG